MKPSTLNKLANAIALFALLEFVVWLGYGCYRFTHTYRYERLVQRVLG
ncbi:MAG: hypothetical protein ACOY0T_29290 [Myxococcota bacterium]